MSVRRTGSATEPTPESRAEFRPPGRLSSTGPEVPEEVVAKDICLRLLTDRAHTRLELATALRGRGVPDEIADGVLDRFDEVGLIDDEAFAGQWVRSRHRYRGLARQALATQLRRKGVARETVDEALAEVSPEAEYHRAEELVARRLRTLPVDGSDERAKAGRRLLGMLARKGYPAALSYQVVRAALAELGADEDELGPPDLG